MNAMPMIESCATRQAYLSLFGRCESCCTPMARTYGECAACALVTEARFVETRRDRGAK